MVKQKRKMQIAERTATAPDGSAGKSESEMPEEVNELERYLWLGKGNNQLYRMKRRAGPVNRFDCQEQSPAAFAIPDKHSLTCNCFHFINTTICRETKQKAAVEGT